MKKMSQKTKEFESNFNPGENVFSWIAHDYHFHQRGIIWYVVFCFLIFGSALYFLFIEPQGWLTAFTFFLVAAIYFWTHRNGNEDHEIHFFEKGFLVDNRGFYLWEKIEGYWFLYDETVSIINLKLKNKKNNIALQMGKNEPEIFRKVLEKLEIEELENEKETLLDLWIRGLKL